MSTATISRLLAAWDQGHALSPGRRALLLAGAACPEGCNEDSTTLPLGAADARLLALREEIFGHRLDAVCRCPRCSESLEIACATADLRMADPPATTAGPRTLAVAEHRLVYRVPTLGDLATLDTASESALLARCVLSAEAGGAEIPPAALPANVVTALAAALEAADPGACTRIDLRCPACDHAWSAAFDIAGYLWSELDAWAAALVREVHALASAYGWTEAEILALSPRRRRLYLELLAGP